MEMPKHVVAVDCLISDAQNRVLLKRHPQRGWEFPGGKVEVGEDLIGALLREVREETGLEIAVRCLAAVYSNTSPVSLVLFSFLADYISGELRTSEESIEIGWFDRDSAVEQIAFPPTRHRADDLVHFRQMIYRAYDEPDEETKSFSIRKEIVLNP